MLRTHLITPGSYADPASAAREEQAIFRRAWHLAAMAFDIPTDNDYVRAKIGNTDLVLHRQAEDIVAYANVCPHRFSQFFSEARGNGPMRCPYHLWSFGADGYASGVPYRGGTPLACYQTEALRLAVWHIQCIGAFVFVSAEPVQELPAFLGPLHAYFQQLSGALAGEITSNEDDIEADWKVVMQNTVEIDHVQSVHAKTYAAVMRKPLQLECGLQADNVISYHVPMREDLYARKAAARVDAIYRRASYPYIHGHAFHLLFPSTTLSIMDNRHLAIINYQPAGCGMCRMKVRYIGLRIPDLTASETSMLALVSASDLEFSRQIIAEDKAVCESIQRGLASRPTGLLGTLLPGEELVYRFQEIYRRWMA